MSQLQENMIHGLTGEISQDGVLSPDLQMKLDGIQHEAAQTVLWHLSQRQEGGLFPIAAMATGIGKTRIEHEIIKGWRRKNPHAKILFIAGTKIALVDQSTNDLTEYQLGNGVGNYNESENLEDDSEDIEEVLKAEQKALTFYKVGKLTDKDVDVKVATIQTVQSAIKRGAFDPKEVGLVIVDEVHNIGTKQRFSTIQKFENVVGFTATPYRSSGKMRVPEQYGFMCVYNFTLPEAQNLRLLPPLLGIQVNTSGLVDEIPTNPATGQINYASLEKILKNSPDLLPFIANKVTNIIKDGVTEYKTVIVVNFVWEARELAQLLKEKGIKVGVAVNQQAAKVIHSEHIPALDAIDRYKLPQSDPNSLQVLISPYVASEGFNAPFTEVLVWASPTDSELRYTQYTGRLARRASGKAFGLVVDFLYQTKQFNWNYNFGMWMKGGVKQLSNGLLYLGSEQDIKELADLDVVKIMTRKGETMVISDLQAERMERLAEGEIVLSSEQIREFFRGVRSELKRNADEIIELLKPAHPEYFAKRLSSTSIVDVVTNEGKTAFIEEMRQRGIEQRDLEITKTTDLDLPITANGFKGVFMGNYNKLRTIANKVIGKLQQQYPEYFAKRMSGTATIDVVTAIGRDKFIKAMREEGVTFIGDRQLEELSDEDLPLTQKGTYLNLFEGRVAAIKSIVDEVSIVLKEQHPEYFEERWNKNTIVSVVTDKGRNEFIRQMIEKGMALRKPIVNIKETDLTLGQVSLKNLFIGDSNKLKSIAQEVASMLKADNPEYFTERKNRSHTINVVTMEGRHAFIEGMTARGVKLRHKNS